VDSVILMDLRQSFTDMDQNFPNCELFNFQALTLLVIFKQTKQALFTTLHYNISSVLLHPGTVIPNNVFVSEENIEGGERLCLIESFKALFFHYFYSINLLIEQILAFIHFPELAFSEVFNNFVMLIEMRRLSGPSRQLYLLHLKRIRE